MKMTILWVAIISFCAGATTSWLFTTKSRLSEAGHSDLSDESDADVREQTNEVELDEQALTLIDVNTVAARRTTFVERVPVRGQIARDAIETVHLIAPHRSLLVECKTKIGNVVAKDEVLCVLQSNEAGYLTEIKSPISGVVIADYTKQGAELANLSSLHTVADLSRLYANFDVYERDISGLAMGQKLVVTCISYPNDRYGGEVIFISPGVDENTRTIKIRAVLENPQNRLKLGMFVNAEILVESQEQFIIVPQQAVLHAEGGRFVFVQMAEGKFESRRVSVAKETREQVAISSGLNEGDLVVTNGAFLLKSELFKSKMGAGCAE